MILGLETHFVLSVMEFRYLMFQPSVQEIECNLSPKSVSFFSKRCFACTQPSSQAGLEPTSSPGALFFLSLGVTGKRETWEAGNEACLKPNFTTVAFEELGMGPLHSGCLNLALHFHCSVKQEHGSISRRAAGNPAYLNFYHCEQKVR